MREGGKKKHAKKKNIDISEKNLRRAPKKKNQETKTYMQTHTCDIAHNKMTIPIKNTIYLTSHLTSSIEST